MTIHLLELASKKKGNYNIMKLYDQLYDGSKPIGTILYHNLFQDWLLLNYLSPNLPNLLSQPLQSTFRINFLNQCIFELAMSLACGILSSQIYIYKKMYLYLLSYIWFRWLTFLQIAYSLSHGVYHFWAFLIVLKIKVQLDATRTSLICRY